MKWGYCANNRAVSGFADNPRLMALRQNRPAIARQQPY
jgi:hypothetical protein